MRTLSIYIPTYNRPDSILKLLTELTQQLVDNVKIVVLDNASTTVIQTHCLEKNPNLVHFHKQGQLEFIRHVSNIGMSANFLRAFENCDTEWMWLLSDDDLIKDDCIQSILNTVQEVQFDPDVAMIKFSSVGCEKPDSKRYLTSLEELIDIMKISDVHFNSYIFITNMVYRFPQFKSKLQIGYQNAHTFVPHLMMVIDYMYYHHQMNTLYLSEKFLATYKRPEVGYSYGLLAGLGVGAFKNFMYDLPKKKYLELEGVFAAHNDFKVAIDLYYQAKAQANKFVRNKLIENYYYLIRYARSPFQRVLLRFFFIFIRSSVIFELFLSIVRKASPLIEMHVHEMEIKYKPIKKDPVI